MKESFFVASFGCKTNQYHGMVLRQNLIDAGFIEVNDWKKADTLIVSACVVTQRAEQEIKKTLLKGRKLGKNVFAVGCFGENLSSELSREEIVHGGEREVFQSIVSSTLLPYCLVLRDTGKKSRAFVNIQMGCHQFCSYCIVPFTRGRPISREKSQIMQEIYELTQQGIKEIVLTGTQIGLYGQKQDSESLTDLMISIEERFKGKLSRARISSIHPLFVNHKLLELIGTSELWCNHMHISLQSGSNRILSLMNRQYTSEDFFGLILSARKWIPGVLFTTDAIVGFPGETEEDFQKTIDLVKNVSFSKVHVFPYSPRKETLSSSMGCCPPSPVVQDRKKRLLELSKILSYNLNRTFLGKKVEVLIEKDLTGFTRNYRKVVLKKDILRLPHHLCVVEVSACNSEMLLE